MDAGVSRVGSAGDFTSQPSLAALIQLLSALQNGQQTTDAAQALPSLAEKIEQHAAAVFQVLPDIATDATVALWEASRPLLESAVGAQDLGAEQAAKVCCLGRPNPHMRPHCKGTLVREGTPNAPEAL